MYIPHDMIPHSSSSLNFYSSYYHFILFILFNFEDGDNSKIPFFCTAGNRIVHWNGKEFIIIRRPQLSKKSFHESKKFPVLRPNHTDKT